MFCGATACVLCASGWAVVTAGFGSQTKDRREALCNPCESLIRSNDLSDIQTSVSYCSLAHNLQIADFSRLAQPNMLLNGEAPNEPRSRRSDNERGGLPSFSTVRWMRAPIAERFVLHTTS